MYSKTENRGGYFIFRKKYSFMIQLRAAVYLINNSKHWEIFHKRVNNIIIFVYNIYFLRHLRIVWMTITKILQNLWICYFNHVSLQKGFNRTHKINYICVQYHPMEEKYFWHVWWKWNTSLLIIISSFIYFIFSHKSVSIVRSSIDLFEKHNSIELNKCKYILFVQRMCTKI